MILAGLGCEKRTLYCLKEEMTNLGLVLRRAILMRLIEYVK